MPMEFFLFAKVRRRPTIMCYQFTSTRNSGIIRFSSTARTLSFPSMGSSRFMALKIWSNITGTIIRIYARNWRTSWRNIRRRLSRDVMASTTCYIERRSTIISMLWKRCWRHRTEISMQKTSSAWRQFIWLAKIASILKSWSCLSNEVQPWLAAIRQEIRRSM